MRAHALLSRTSLIASAIISLTAVPAFAQDSAGTTASEDEGAIVVTARRREENLVECRSRSRRSRAISSPPRVRWTSPPWPRPFPT